VEQLRLKMMGGLTLNRFTHPRGARIAGYVPAFRMLFGDFGLEVLSMASRVISGPELTRRLRDGDMNVRTANVEMVVGREQEADLVTASPSVRLNSTQCACLLRVHVIYGA
jgi:hypothetical protein